MYPATEKLTDGRASIGDVPQLSNPSISVLSPLSVAISAATDGGLELVLNGWQPTTAQKAIVIAIVDVMERCIVILYCLWPNSCE